MTTDTIFRVIPVTDGLRQRIKDSREADQTTNQSLISRAVTSHLSQLVTSLQAIGFGADPGATRPARLPFSDATLAELKDASEATGLPATDLLRLCLLAATEAPEAPRKPRSRKTAAKPPTASKGRRNAKKTPSRNPRQTSPKKGGR